MPTRSKNIMKMVRLSQVDSHQLFTRKIFFFESMHWLIEHIVGIKIQKQKVVQIYAFAYINVGGCWGPTTL